MTISGSSPLGGAGRVANAYGIAERPASKPAEGPTSKVDNPSSAFSSRLSTASAKPAGIPLSAVLNDEERAYFDQLETMGPITYGPGGRGGMVPDAPRGIRLDVRG